ncbi:MAG TPA: M56 family metallopeptidase, partial [Sedimentisphaerales bacterium]|nr:M56 family metallopeptidase [Sedimentisphaerales bacterium]
MQAFITQLSLFFGWVLVSSAQAAVLVCLIFLVKAIIRNRLAVRWHYWLWLIVLVRMVMPWAPASSFSVFTLIGRAKITAPAEYIPKLTDTAEAPGLSPQGHTPDLLHPHTPPAFAPAVPQPAASLSLNVIDILSLLWATVALSLAFFASVCNFRLWRIVKSQRLLTEAKILDLFEDCKARMNIQTIVGLVVTDKVASPALFGVVRPRLLMPAGMLEIVSARQLRYIFLHELAHLKRRDIYLGYLMVILQLLHWFNPLVWLAFARMRTERELACDALVLSTVASDEAQPYGQTLVDVFKRFARIPYAPAVAGILENKSQLKRRITMVADFKKGSYRWSIWAVVLLVVLGAVFLTNAQPASQPDDTPVADLAKDFVALLVNEQFPDAVEQFDKTMKKSLPADKLASTWRSTTAPAGPFVQQLGIRQEKFLASDIVIVTCEFEKGPLDVKVVYDSQRRISGLWLLPVPEDVLKSYRPRPVPVAPPAISQPGAPCVVSTSPQAFADDVSPDLTEITVTFDKPMMNLSWSWVGGGETFPEMAGQPRYNRTKTTCTLPVKLQAGKFYWVGINSPKFKNFQTDEHIPAVPYVMLFATKDRFGKPTPIPENFIEEAKQINASSEPKAQPTPADTIGLQGLIDSAKPNSTVVIPNGLYTKPVEIRKSLTIKGQSKTGCIIEVTADKPAVFVDTAGKGSVTIEDMTIKWQLAASDNNVEHPFAVAIKDTKAALQNCSFEPLGNFKQSPVAVRAVGFSDLTINACRFDGFDYVICYNEGTEGTVRDSLIKDCGHQGIMLYSGAKVQVVGNVITGSKYHAVRSTGGTLQMQHNLIIKNANRGVYLGNKSARGIISDNIIIGNGTGISAFAQSEVTIENNIIADSGYAGIG